MQITIELHEDDHGAIEYLKYAVRNQAFADGRKIEKAIGFLDKVEKEIEVVEAYEERAI